MLAKTLFIGKNIINLSECHSTNDYFSSLLKEKKQPEGTLIITENQTRGKGQRGNVWAVEPGKNLTFSINLYPRMLPARYQFFLNMVISLGITESLNELFSKLTFLIKWPNDIYVNGCKTGGILLENFVNNNFIKTSICGIGINVNQAKFPFSKATSIYNLIHQECDKEMILEAISCKIEKWYFELQKGVPNEKMMRVYQENLLNFNKPQKLRSQGNIFTGFLHGVDNEGNLIVENEGNFFKYGFKEVEFIGS